MIHGIGTDIVAVSRLRSLWERHGGHALDKLLGPGEREDFERAADKGRFLAKRFAAKEAFAKAYGTGFRGPLTLPSLAVIHDAAGRPAFAYSDEIASLLLGQGLIAHLSISDEAEFAVAYVILEKP